jgi:C-3',4' desaturase CrtD
MKKIWDYIVIGSGMGGLSAGAVLAKSGASVLVMEKGTSPGGCCSSFTRAGYIFEAGATTLVGFEPGLPMAALESQASVTFPKQKLSLSMKIHMHGQLIHRFSLKEKWVEECVRVFGRKRRQKLFWNFTLWLSRSVWDISSRYSLFPFTSLGDVLRSLRFFRLVDPIAFLFSFLTTKQVLFLFGLSGDTMFKKFIDEQLLITTQCTSDTAPFLSASAGLSYPQLDNFYIPGGMVEIPRTLLTALSQNGGECLFKTEVTFIEQELNEGEGKGHKNALWKVKTKNAIYQAKNIISNIPIWNLKEIYLGKGDNFEKDANRFEAGIWGAFTIGIALRTKIPTSECLHHQIHLKHALPHGGGESIFVSLSQEDDTVRSKAGIRILSISTHIKNPEHWEKNGKVYAQKKEEIVGEVIQALAENLDWFSKEDIVFLHSASPVTWQSWTGRKFGRVGGIPSHYFKNPFSYLGSVSKIPNLYLTGDTAYPGQGVPAVCLGGMNLARRLLKIKRD